MEEFFSTSTVNLKRAEIICYILTITFFTGGMLFAVMPLFTKKHTTPIDTVYFMLPRDKQWGQSFIYALNIMQIINAGSSLFLDMLMIWIMWHVACKFNLLAREFTIFEEKKLKFWIKRHQDALSYVNEINSIIAPLAVKSTFAVGIDIIVSGVVTTRNLNLVELTKFFIVTMFSLLRFVACSWVADTMTEKARNIAGKIYGSPWIYTRPRMRKMALLIMQRCQKSVAIHTGGFLSAWTLEFCGLVLYTIVTYLMTLRAIIRV
ncbi:uncharacterized protein LOC114873049 [Osmia bicornis bicornis]|uniref:uncharacterized protein LOC114873049 n=1 Tax=Osmia bicornis bicornis TaxID=1437191 RepID=UPI001EAE9106|nr:uncharacterized protein LOC114873049 [Osmia bicornis bicornis]